MPNHKPKIGVALSGGSGRAITHIGVLEVLTEQNIPIDYLTACSSGTIIAASFACGTMSRLKEEWLKFDKGFLLKLLKLDDSGRGLLDSERIEEINQAYTVGKKFEEVSPILAFVCADIVKGEPIILNLGDLAHAVRAACAVPGLFEPVEWGNKLLVDGGLFSIIPTREAKEMGAEVVIGVDIAATRYMFTRKFYRMRKVQNFLTNSLPARLYGKLHSTVEKVLNKSIDYILQSQSDVLEASKNKKLDFLNIWGRAIDIAMQQSETRNEHLTSCDCLISPDVKHHGKTDLENSKKMYLEGRRAALEAIPEIQKVIKDWEWRQANEK